MKECPNCHNANKYGDYEGPTCQVCLGGEWEDLPADTFAGTAVRAALMVIDR